MISKQKTEDFFDVIVIGSGFGGSMAAKVLVEAGLQVLMLERGEWVERGPHNWGPGGSVDLTPHYFKESPIRVLAGGNKKIMGSYAAVGGPSVFYGGVSIRFRETDFTPSAEILAGSRAEWPYSYADLEPYYSQAEHILGVAGDESGDPTEPFHSQPYRQQPAELAVISRKIQRAAQNLGLQPFQLPLAINHSLNGRPACINCTTCDTFACAINAKNDLATVVLPQLIKKGMQLLPNTVATRLVRQNGKIVAVETVNSRNGERRSFNARHFILSAGALGSPHLLLTSGLDEVNPGGKTIGHYLMRHVNAIVFGVFPHVADKENRFHKQLGINDFYFGHPAISHPKGKLGSLQQLQTPPAGLVEKELPLGLGKLVAPGLKLLTGILTIAEDQPQYSNCLDINRQMKDRIGLPQLQIRHQYSSRDLAALKALTRQAKKILRASGALFHYVHHIRTFSHAVGTVRMGVNPQTSALDAYCGFRGIGNLQVVDGSFMPTSAGLNPSLTIAANALWAGEFIRDQWPPRDELRG